jgi:pimeloyl-ACP methyl ester carboxylesterase
MSALAYTRAGSGAPLVLLHGIGMSRRVWEPVLPALAERFDVIAVDLPGFGDSPLPPSSRCDPASLAASVSGLLDELDITLPHLAGNSLGGWVALELAAQRAADSLTLLSPAGLWRQGSPRYCRVSLRLSRWMTRYLARPLSFLVRWRLGRIIALGQTHGRPWALSAVQARRTIRDMGQCSGFDTAFTSSVDSRYAPAVPVTCPVTVAFGSRDWLLRPRHSRHIERLPAGCRIESLPRCGHVPMADDPQAVAAVIAAGASRSVSARPPRPAAGPQRDPRQSHSPR